MILLLRDRFDREYRLGVHEGRFVDAGAAAGDSYDLRRMVALGGLADCHAHLSGDDVADMIEYDGTGLNDKMLRNARLQLEGGVLLLAEKGSKSPGTLRFLEVAAELRPRLRMAGRMIAAPGGYYPGFGAEMDESNLEEVIGAATEGGATWVKIVGDWPRKGRGAVPSYTEETLARIATLAHDAGCRVAIHTAAPNTPGMAVRAGFDSIEHGLFLTRQDLDLLGERGGAWVPTVVAMESTARWLGASSTGAKVLGEGLENTRELLGYALDAGVAVLAGTDLALPHGGVAREALRLIDYGLGAEQALHAATTAAYEYLGVDAGFAPGLPADVVCFADDPGRDSSLLLAPTLVIRSGEVITGAL